MDAYVTLLIAATEKNTTVVSIAQAIADADRAENATRHRYALAWVEGRIPRRDR